MKAQAPRPKGKEEDVRRPVQGMDQGETETLNVLVTCIGRKASCWWWWWAKKGKRNCRD